MHLTHAPGLTRRVVSHLYHTHHTPPVAIWLKSNFGSNWHCNSKFACPEPAEFVCAKMAMVLHGIVGRLCVLSVLDRAPPLGRFWPKFGSFVTGPEDRRCYLIGTCRAWR